MRIYNILFAVSLSFSLVSCDFISTAYKETFQVQKQDEAQLDTAPTETKDGSALEEVTPATVQINILEDAEKLAEVQEKLQAMFSGKPLSIYPPHIYFDQDRIRVQVVDPDIPENIDWYYYSAETDLWEKKEPVKTSVSIVRKPIPMSAVNFSTAHRVYRQIADKAATIEGAEMPSSVYFSFNVPEWNWNARIVGSRSDYTFRTDRDGKQIEFEKQ